MKSLPNLSFAKCVLPALLLLAGCSHPSEGAAKGGAADKPQSDNPTTAKSNFPANPYSDAGRFLAGLPGRPDGPFHELEQTPQWKEYSQKFDEVWDRTQKKQFELVDGFEKAELAPIKTGSSYVFYPFSGPDVLYATRFFPHGKIYILCGLEPVGTIPTPAAFPKEKLGAELNAWSEALKSIFSKSFFVTSEMDHHFRREVSDGLMPTMVLLLARNGYSTDAARYGKLTKEGAFVDETEPVKKHEGVEITFHKDGDDQPRKIYYFSMKIGKEFAEDPRFALYLKSLGRPDTLVKSGQFLLHWRDFDALRKYILDDSNLILQDDTGVPYRYFFKGHNWKVQLYGQYSEPDDPFKKEYQKDMAAAFEDPKLVKPLPFRLGYGYWRRPSSMLLATKIASVSQR